MLLGIVFSLEVFFVPLADFSQTVAVELVFSAEGLVARLTFVLFEGRVRVFVSLAVVSAEKAEIAESALIFSFVSVASLVAKFFLLSDKSFRAVVAFKLSVSGLRRIVLAVFFHLSKSTGILSFTVGGGGA